MNATSGYVDRTVDGDPPGDQLRGLEARALGRAHADLELGLVVDRQEVLVRDLEERQRRQQHGQRDQARRCGGGPAPTRAASGSRGRSGANHALSREVCAGCAASPFLAPSLQPARAEHRRQREADQQRHQDGERHAEPEALHEPADDAAHEPDRQEDRDQRQRRREHGQADLLRRLHRRLERVLPLLLDEPVDVLQHHDRIVDDDADREREREHGHRVEREALVPDEAEGRDDRRRDRDGRDDRRAPVAEEDQHDQRGEEAADDQVLLHRADRRLDEVALVADDRDAVARRHRRAQFLEAVLDVLDDLDGVGARLPPDVQHDRRRAVDAGQRAGVLHAVLDGGDVGHRDGMPLAHPDDDARELLDRRRRGRGCAA